MAKFHGVIGFAHTTVESPGGVHKEVVTERPYFGDVVRSARRMAEGENLNPELSLTTSLSVVLDAYLTENIFAIRYVVRHGKRWVVTEVDDSSPPRVQLRLGGVYRGPTPAP